MLSQWMIYIDLRCFWRKKKVKIEIKFLPQWMIYIDLLDNQTLQNRTTRYQLNNKNNKTGLWDAI